MLCRAMWTQAAQGTTVAGGPRIFRCVRGGATMTKQGACGMIGCLHSGQCRMLSAKTAFGDREARRQCWPQGVAAKPGGDAEVRPDPNALEGCGG